MSTFFGLNISRLGMQAQQKALEVTAHNVANANTPGYSRQVAGMSTTTPLPYPNGQGMLGSGVKVSQIARVRELFLDNQIRDEMHILGNWESRKEYLSQVEMIFMEPSDTGFNSVLSTFFDSWQELSLSPESSPARAALVENANFLVNSIQHTYTQLESVRADITKDIELKVNDLNSLAEQIKDLNQQITTLTAKGDSPNDLMDRRDLLLDNLAKMVNYDLHIADNGAVNIFIGGRPLVQQNIVNTLKTVEGTPEQNSEWLPGPQIVWSRDERPTQINSGEIAGLIATRDDDLRKYMEEFESMAWGLVDSINEYHNNGMDLTGEYGIDFFTGDHLKTIGVNKDIQNDLRKIAASTPPIPRGEDGSEEAPFKPAPGDGSNAVQISQLRNSRITVNSDAKNLRGRLELDDEGGTTFANFYRDTIARLGVDSQESIRMATNQTSLVEMMSDRRDSISGVSIDEEMANMVQFQLSYQASARVITTLDEIYDTLINRMVR
ncbi:flagellar hook-associated protein FlgK [Dethiobacter alkaliphilus]|uniref:Flagellar hook-associated protein 1 n=1 Tax=Dethiobacter alkaliphilus AHT 1 TaxID=555088 RepID=C0GJJ1_DETAL|nr:flagellar hook-associated protein FlgK [Dethiobacter alkaliphilus]EEG76538.1 flagellar hook-associated protein FlgK [Dethiobacter alkaliphilus AHT 1]